VDVVELDVGGEEVAEGAAPRSFRRAATSVPSAFGRVTLTDVAR
jgi:hypothetical protein